MIVERPPLERRVLESLDHGRIPVVLGGCGAGRTSLLLRIEELVGRRCAQYIDFAAAATTPERCYAAIAADIRTAAAEGTPAATPASPRDAVDALFQYFDRAAHASAEGLTVLIDEFLDIRTFENFPGLRHVQRDFIAHLSASPARFVLAARFTARTHRLLRDAPARFEVVHLPPLDVADVRHLSQRMNGDRADRHTAHVAGAVAALCAGRAAYATLLLDAVASLGPSVDPVAAMAALFKPDGRLTARCRESYEFRLHRARGYGALKAIVSILADTEPLTLTEIALRLQRTPGSTKDYLSWLEDVDLIVCSGKRYSIDDPLVRLYVRLYGHPSPPSDDDIVREVSTYARARVPVGPAAVESNETAAPPRELITPTEARRSSGIVEID
jgi:hypothetical protein